MCGGCSLDSLWEIVLYADETLIAAFPRDLFFDDDLLWHQQHLGRAGQVAAVDIVLRGEDLFTMAHQSDLVQRISRRRGVQDARREAVQGLAPDAFNGIVDFAREHGARLVHFPTADFALRNTDRKRIVERTLFDRLYDRNVRSCCRSSVRATGGCSTSIESVTGSWCPSAARTQASWFGRSPSVTTSSTTSATRVALAIRSQMRPSPLRSRRCSKSSATSASERRTTSWERSSQNGDEIRADGHCMALAAYDHAVDKPEQLARCRQVDSDQGLRCPAVEAHGWRYTDDNLAFHNFEWIASSSLSLGKTGPR